MKEEAKYTAKQIAKWFVDRSARDSSNGDYMTQLKLQKTLYFAKSFFFLFENKPLFEEKFYAQKLGPVLQSVMKVVSKYGREPIKSEFINENPIEEKETIVFLEFIYKNIVSTYATSKLVDITHSEEPWQKTSIGKKIQDELIQSFYSNRYSNQENEGLQLPVSKESLFLAIAEYNLAKNDKAYKVLAQ